MSFNWSEYFDVAQELFEQVKHPSPHQEAKLRIAISRAYYAAFGMARDHLRLKDKIWEPRTLTNVKRERVSVHEYVIDQFINSPDSKRVEIGVNLDRLRKYRNAADYHLNDLLLNNISFTTQATLRWAKEVLSDLKKL